MDKYQKLANAIKQARLAKGISQEEFAEILDVSATHVKHMESGHRKPSVDMLFSICENTGLSVDNILNGTCEKDDEIDVNLNTVINLCTYEEKILITKIIEAMISNRK